MSELERKGDQREERPTAGREQARTDAQSHFVGQLVARLLPPWLVNDARKHRRVIAMAGCGEGASTVALAQALPEVQVIGIDSLSREVARARQLHPAQHFEVAPLDAAPEAAQVLVLANPLENQGDPRRLLRAAARPPHLRALALLVPLREGRGEGVEPGFDYDSFPLRLGTLTLVAFEEVDLRGTPEERFLHGKSAFALWAHEEAFEGLSATLENVLSSVHRAQSRLATLRAEMRRLEQEDRRRLVELTETRRQLAEALVEVRSLEERGAPTGAEPVRVETRYVPDPEAQARAAALRAELDELKGTLKWRFSSRLASALDRSGLRLGLRAARSLDRQGVWGTARTVTRAARRRLIARSQLVPTQDPWDSLVALRPLPVRVVDDTYEGAELLPFSIVTTVRNEEENIVEFLRSIAAQRAMPSEVIIVDGGSVDSTVSLVKEFARTAPFKVIVIDEGPCNIAAGRNKGLRVVSEEVVVLVDAGCSLRPDFFSAMVGPFSEPEVDLVGGIYVAAAGAQHARPFIRNWYVGDYEQFLPSARAVAVRAPIARLIGGFPEYLSHTGEDTLFDIAYRRVSRTWVVNREAVVEWHGPATAPAAAKLISSYCKGDGESGVGDRRFYRQLVDHMQHTLGPLPPDEQAALAGYLAGRERRALVEMNRRKVRGVVVIFDAPQLTDFSGDRRIAHLVTELTRQSFKVVHVSVLEPDIRTKRYLDLDQSLLELYHVNDFSPKDLARRYGERLLGIVIEADHPALVPAVEALHALVPRAPIVRSEPDEVAVTRVDEANRARAAAALEPLLSGWVRRTGARRGHEWRTAIIPDGADLRVYSRSLHEARPRGWPEKWKERVAIVPVPFAPTEPEGNFLRSVARANPTLGFVLLTANESWEELRQRWGIVERNVSGVGWTTAFDLACWVTNAAAVVLPWSMESPERQAWAVGWGERAAAVNAPAVARSDRSLSANLITAPATGFARQLLQVVEHPPRAEHQVRSWQQNAHELIHHLFSIGR